MLATNSPETALIAPSPIEVLAAQFAEMQADMRQMRARVDAMTHRRWRWRPLARERGWQAAQPLSSLERPSVRTALRSG
jgi:hypothetical protein